MGYKDNDDFWTLDKLIPPKSVRQKKDNYVGGVTDGISFAEIKQEEKSKKHEEPLSLVSVPDLSGQSRSSEKTSETVTQRIVFPESKVLVSAQLSPALSYSMRGQGFLKSALDAERSYSEVIEREDLPFDGNMTEREKAIHVPIYTLMPTFRDMSPSQKKWYEYWKHRQTEKRKLNTESSYFYLYISETLNLCEGEFISSETALDRLLWLAETYCKDDSGIEIMLRRILSDCIFDLVISKELSFPAERLAGIFDENYIPSRPLLCSVYIADYVLSDESFIKKLDKDALDFVFRYISDHDYTKSKYYKRDIEYAAFADKCFADTAPAVLVSDCIENGKTGESSAMISASLMTTTRRLYPGALIDTQLTQTIVLEHYPVFADPSFRAASGALFKYIENKVRSVYGIKTKMSGVNINEERRKKVDKYFYPLEEMQRNESVRKSSERARDKKYTVDIENKETAVSAVKTRSAEDIIIDTGKASLIEEASWVNTAKLMEGVEYDDVSSGDASVIYSSLGENEENVYNEDGKTEENIRSDEISDGISDEYEAFVKSLDGFLLEVLKCLFEGKISEAGVLCKKHGTFLQAASESINDKAADTIGDIVINDDNEIIEDYREEIFERIKHKWMS